MCILTVPDIAYNGKKGFHFPISDWTVHHAECVESTKKNKHLWLVF